MRDKPRAATHNSDDELEDGEIEGELYQQPAHNAPSALHAEDARSPPRKQRKMSQKADAGRSRHHEEPHAQHTGVQATVHTSGHRSSKRASPHQSGQHGKIQYQHGSAPGAQSSVAADAAANARARKAELIARLADLEKDEEDNAPGPHQHVGKERSGGKERSHQQQDQRHQKRQPDNSQAAQGHGSGGYVDVYGKDARPSIENKATGEIRLQDVQALVLWAATPSGCVQAPRWAFLKNKPLLRRVVLVLANGLSRGEFTESKELMPFLSSLPPPATVVALNSHAKPAQTTAALLNTNAKRKRKRGDQEEEDGGEDAAAAGAECDAGGEGPEQAGGDGVDGQDGELQEVEGGDGGLGADGKQASGVAAGQPHDSSGNGHSKGGGSGGGKANGAAPPPPPPPATAATSTPGGAAQQQQRSGKGSQQRQQQHHHRPPFPASHYCASLAQLRQANYPLPSLDATSGQLICPEGFVATRPSGEPSAAERMVALDCEMCITAKGFELTRITLLEGPPPGTLLPPRQRQARRNNGVGEEDGGAGAGAGSSSANLEYRVLLDELVLPHNPITDYNTRYSGITQKMLEGVTTRLEDVRERFLSHVSAETLLVGHALENDLQALRTCHARVLDTALLFPHPKGPPYRSALKVLARRFLKRTIQEGSHDSVIDARTALDLVLLKIKHGPSYGTGVREDTATKLVDVMSDHGVRSCLVDRHDTLARYATGSAAAVPVMTDEEAVAMAGKQAAVDTNGFVWTQLTELSTFMFRRTKHTARLEDAAVAAAATQAAGGSGAAARDAALAAAAAAGSSPPSAAGATAAGGSPNTADYSEARFHATLASLDRRLAALWAALPPATLLLVASGQGDTAAVERLYELKCKRGARPPAPGYEGRPWSVADEDAFATKAAREILGLCFMAVKH